MFAFLERVGKDIARLEETIAEQESANERLQSTLLLRQEEADIMSQILKVKDKELTAAAKQVAQMQFQMDCLRGDVAELQHQVRLTMALRMCCAAVITACAKRTAATASVERKRHGSAKAISPW